MSRDRKPRPRPTFPPTDVDWTVLDVLTSSSDWHHRGAAV